MQKKRYSLEEGGGVTNQDLIDAGIDFVPFASTGYSIYKAATNPTGENFMDLAINLGTDIIGARLLKGAVTAGKLGVKAWKAYKAEKALYNSTKGTAHSMRTINKGLERAGQPPRYNKGQIRVAELKEDHLTKPVNPLIEAMQNEIGTSIALDWPISLGYNIMKLGSKDREYRKSLKNQEHKDSLKNK